MSRPHRYGDPAIDHFGKVGAMFLEPVQYDLAPFQGVSSVSRSACSVVEAQSTRRR
jgi:hypothetical protein